MQMIHKKKMVYNLLFKVSNSGFVYLGVHVADTMVNLYKKIFLSLFTQIKLDFERWSLLNL